MRLASGLGRSPPRARRCFGSSRDGVLGSGKVSKKLLHLRYFRSLLSNVATVFQHERVDAVNLGENCKSRRSQD